MIIYFVRHGHPDYKNDCLTELGHKHAAAAAERLKSCGISKVYSSTKGRALQTAGYTAQQFGLEVIPCEFMREIKWGPVDDEPIPENGHPWLVAERFAAEGSSMTEPDWRENYVFCRSKAIESVKIVADGIDAWLEELGFRREGDYYRVIKENTDCAVAMFSHGGSSSAALAHLFNLSFFQFCGFLQDTAH